MCSLLSCLLILTKPLAQMRWHSHLTTKIECSSPIPATSLHFHFVFCVSYLPTEWRIHQVTPVFKSGDRDSINNYHPISLLCCVSKVLRKKSILKHLISSQSRLYLTSNFGFGFLTNCSTLKQLLTFLDSEINIFFNKEQVIHNTLTSGRRSTQFLTMSSS